MPKSIRDPILFPPGRLQILTGPGGRIAIYASSNTFTATGGTYSVAGGSGYEAGDAGTLYVYQASNPVTLTAGFTGTPTSGVAPLTVHLTDTATPAGAADQWYWTLGDGGSSTAQHPVYTYTQVGVYTVTQRATDTATSQWDALTRTNYITVLAPDALVTRTITYTYDSLYRLTEADYSSGESFQYDYDAAGNMTALTTTLGSTVVTTKAYDAANRLITVTTGAVTRTLEWSDAGELLRDGTEILRQAPLALACPWHHPPGQVRASEDRPIPGTPPAAWPAPPWTA